VINQALDTLTRASHKLAEVMYSQAQQPEAGGAAAGGSADGQKSSGSAKTSEDAIDAEYVDVDESKKPN